MAEQVRVIEGRVVHKVSNALKISFQDGPGEPFATGIQGAGDGKGKKLGVLFGFKNGGTGTHVLTFEDGHPQLRIESRDGKPSVFTRADNTAVITVNRGETSVAVGSDGREILRFLPDPEEAETVESFRMLVSRPDGEEIGRLDVIRTVAGWTVMRAYDALEDLYVWWDRAGQPLKVPVLGTRITLRTEITPLERDILLGASVDLAIGLRPYIAAMS